MHFGQLRGGQVLKRTPPLLCRDTRSLGGSHTLVDAREIRCGQGDGGSAINRHSLIDHDARIARVEVSGFFGLLQLVAGQIDLLAQIGQGVAVFGRILARIEGDVGVGIGVGHFSREHAVAGPEPDRDDPVVLGQFRNNRRGQNAGSDVFLFIEPLRVRHVRRTAFVDVLAEQIIARAKVLFLGDNLGKTAALDHLDLGRDVIVNLAGDEALVDVLPFDDVAAIGLKADLGRGLIHRGCHQRPDHPGDDRRDDNRSNQPALAEQDSAQGRQIDEVGRRLRLVGRNLAFGHVAVEPAPLRGGLRRGNE